MSEGIIQRIEEVHNQGIPPIAPLEGTGGRLGLAGLVNALSGTGSMDGYEVATDKHTYRVLIDNEDSCCESWGYVASDDDLSAFVGADLREVRLTDVALNSATAECATGLDEGGIQFVDFVTDRGALQLAVYNGHNGYYGHGILVAKDDEVLLNDTL